MTKQAEKTRSRTSRRRSGTSENKGARSNNPVIRYFQETGEELKKVTWPSQEDTVRLSTIVLVTTIISTIIFGLFDLGVQELLSGLLRLASG